MSVRGPLGLTVSAWEQLAQEWSEPRYRGRQVFEAIQRQGVRDYGSIQVVPRVVRERLARELPIRLPEIGRREASADGSVKYGLRLSDGALIEAVFMPGEASQATVNEFEDARAARESPESEVQGSRSSETR